MPVRRLLRVLWSIVLNVAVVTAGLAPDASAQTIGTFTWQATPYCNVVAFTVSADGAGFRLTGFDDQCGVGRLPAAGVATPRPDGQYGLSFYIVTPNGLTSHLTAVLSPSSVSSPVER